MHYINKYIKVIVIEFVGLWFSPIDVVINNYIFDKNVSFLFCFLFFVFSFYSFNFELYINKYNNFKKENLIKYMIKKTMFELTNANLGENDGFIAWWATIV